MGQKSEITVQAAIARGGKFLLVHDKGDAQYTGGDNRLPRKPPGWGLPGGGVDKTEPELIKRINDLLVLQKISKNYEEAKRKLETIPYNSEIELPIFLTFISECLEETGFLVWPVRILFEEIVGFKHRVPVGEGRILAGALCKRSLEIDDCDWYCPNQLPEGTYNLHKIRINRAARILGLETSEPEEEMAGSL